MCEAIASVIPTPHVSGARGLATTSFSKAGTSAADVGWSKKLRMGITDFTVAAIRTFTSSSDGRASHPFPSVRRARG